MFTLPHIHTCGAEWKAVVVHKLKTSQCDIGTAGILILRPRKFYPAKNLVHAVYVRMHFMGLALDHENLICENLFLSRN